MTWGEAMARRLITLEGTAIDFGTGEETLPAKGGWLLVCGERMFIALPHQLRSLRASMAAELDAAGDPQGGGRL